MNICQQIHSLQLNGKVPKHRKVAIGFLNCHENRKSHAIVQTHLEKLTSLFNNQKINNWEKIKESVVLLQKEMTLLPFVEGSKFTGIFEQLNGVEIILSLLLHPSMKISPSKDVILLLAANDKELIAIHCLSILLTVASEEETVARFLINFDDFVCHLFTLMENKFVFLNAAELLEELLELNMTVIDLSRIKNISQLIKCLALEDFLVFCRILSMLMSDMCLERTTLFAQRQEERHRSEEITIVEQNQVILLSDEHLIPRFVQYCGLHSFSSEVHVQLPIITQDRERLSQYAKLEEMMFRTQMLYMFSLFLCSKNKSQIQEKLFNVKLIPLLSKQFDKLNWKENDNSLQLHDMNEHSEHFCTPQSALKVQFLRFIHSFCDQNINRYTLFSWNEVKRLKRMCEKHDLKKPTLLSLTHRDSARVQGSFCTGEKGLLVKIIDVLKALEPNAPIRFWLSRAISGFLRGPVDELDQMFLVEQGLVEHLVRHLIDEETVEKELLQSSFDLLGEIMKFNKHAYSRLNECLQTDDQLNRLASVMSSNIIDSNMFIRSAVLSYERFSNNQAFDVSRCHLTKLVMKWENKIYLLYKLITVVSIDSLTQENVSCLNTTIIFLMYFNSLGLLSQCLEVFVSEEHAQKHPGLILHNLWELLLFWRKYYSQKDKDCYQLEQSSSIPFAKWTTFVQLLLSEDAENPTSLLHHLTPKQRTRIKKLDHLFRDS